MIVHSVPIGSPSSTIGGVTTPRGYVCSPLSPLSHSARMVTSLRSSSSPSVSFCTTRLPTPVSYWLVTTTSAVSPAMIVTGVLGSITVSTTTVGGLPPSSGSVVVQVAPASMPSTVCGVGVTPAGNVRSSFVPSVQVTLTTTSPRSAASAPVTTLVTRTAPVRMA